MLRIYCGENYDEMSRKAANIIAAQVITKPDCVLGLATGSSPIGTYKQLIDWYEKGDLDFSQVSTVNLDEYQGLSHEDSQSYYYFMNENLFKHVNIDQAHTNLPNGLAKNVEEECERYNKVIQSCGGVDLQLLGIGHNGHIGFNEPAEVFEKETHLVELAESTIKANARLFENENDVPRHAFTMGIKTIMQAKKVVIVVSGEDKAKIIKEAFFGPVTPKVPASILQMHNDVCIVGDKAALSLI
ncbi:MAG: glucosamine-6-phosphate deaminase [Lachnospiraceae bacterium]|nr:glucosamine-6-phosphate deaminase [Lachnospiraceae bacterium]